MIAGFLIVFREVLEAALIVGIVTSYLFKRGAGKYLPGIWLSVAAGVLASVLGAFLFSLLAGGFSGYAEKLYEGIVMIAGAVLVTTLILWMMKEESQVNKLKDAVRESLSSGRLFGLYAIVFISILREGIELVIFLRVLSVSQGPSHWLGVIAGFVASIAFGLLMFLGGRNLNLKTFFKITNVILILFAAGMLAYGIHELQEAGVIPVVVEHVYDINPKVISEGNYPLLHEKGALGTVFKGLFGYNGNPSLIEIISYLFYLAGIFTVWKYISAKKGKRG